MAFSNYAQSGLLNHLLRGSTFSKPSNISIALTSDVPLSSDNGFSMPEIETSIGSSGTGYARVSLGDPSISGNNFWSQFNPQSNGSGYIENSVSITFGTALMDWGYVSGFAILDNSSTASGNILFFSKLTNPRIVYAGDTPAFNPSNLDIILS